MTVVQLVTWGISLAMLTTTILLAFRKEHKEEGSENKQMSIAFAKMDVKQDAVLQAVNDIRADQKAQGTRITDLEKQMAIIDNSVKSAHHRIDEISR